MTQDLWLNLPVRDLARAKEFFTQLGFVIKEHPGLADKLVSLVVGDQKMIVNLFPHNAFEQFTGAKIADTAHHAEILLSLGAASRDEVDFWARKVTAAGGTIYGGPGETDGWMYGFGFSDLDGHRWNILYMDMERMP